MSKVLDTKNFTKAYIDDKGVSEMFFDNELIYVASKKKPEITCTVEKAETPLYFKLTYQFEDWAHKLRYFDAAGIQAYGFLAILTNRLPMGRPLTLDTSGRTRIWYDRLSVTGSATYNFKSIGVNTRYTIRAYMQYKNEQGHTAVVYSPQRIYLLAKLS